MLRFLYHLRDAGIRVATTEWLDLIGALVRGHGGCSLNGFYGLSRALLVKFEGDYDRFDRAFGAFFHGASDTLDISDELMRWLENPTLPPRMSEAELAALKAIDLDTLRRAFADTLRDQRERHDGGSRWVGTGGTSPFGHGGRHPSGVRVGGTGGSRSAVQVAELRRFENLRSDRVLDTRQFGLALRRLRRLAREDGPEELDLDETVDRSGREGEIAMVFRPERRNRVKLLLLMDVGGSMDPFADLCERLFSAASQAKVFRKFRHYFFHNCVYEKVYTDMWRYDGERTQNVLSRLDRSWSVMLVGDAWMSPYELIYPGGNIYMGAHNPKPGIDWLRAIRRRCPRSLWLNPEPERIWGADSVRMVRSVFPMFPLTLRGLGDAVDLLRGATRGFA